MHIGNISFSFFLHHFSWASDNLFTGKLPEFIGTLIELRDLYARISEVLWFGYGTSNISVDSCVSYHSQASWGDIAWRPYTKQFWSSNQTGGPVRPLNLENILLHHNVCFNCYCKSHVFGGKKVSTLLFRLLSRRILSSSQHLNQAGIQFFIYTFSEFIHSKKFVFCFYGSCLLTKVSGLFMSSYKGELVIWEGKILLLISWEAKQACPYCKASFVLSYLLFLAVLFFDLGLMP